jgi:hypothetical protein
MASLFSGCRLSPVHVIHLMDNERVVKAQGTFFLFIYTLSCRDWAIVYARTIFALCTHECKKKKETHFMFSFLLGRRRRPDLKTVTLDLSQRTTVA